MISRSTLLHLRIPFSFYLMPVFFFAASRQLTYRGPGWYCNVWDAFAYPSGKEWVIVEFILVFLSIHLFLYPASNGFNSYYDKDEKAIGGLENPPPVTKELLYTSLLFDLAAIALGSFVSLSFTLMLFVYGLISKAYSHPSIRLKKYGITAWLTAGVFQGGFTFLMVLMAVQDIGWVALKNADVFIPVIVSTIMILGFYPLTQVYQHEEDAKHGDKTISRMLGIRGTFILSLIMFLIADIGFYVIYCRDLFQMGSISISWFWIFQLFLVPVFGYFLWWMAKCWKNRSAANFRNTMRMNKIAAWCLVIFFILYGALAFTIQVRVAGSVYSRTMSLQT